MQRPAAQAPSREALSALPSPAARAVAFAAILLGGLAGGLIGWSFVSLQSSGDSDLPAATAETQASRRTLNTSA